MTRFIDLTGAKYGRLTVLSRSENTKNGNARFLCKCDCGNEKVISAYYLKDGQIQSCGCYSKESRTKHGKHKSTEYTIWAGILQRCNNPNDLGYKNYGARGVKVCDRWLDFKNFYEDMGNRPSKNHSVERKDVNGNYEPSNCVWATRFEQSINTRVRADNTSGHKGIGWNKRVNKWRVRIVVHGKEIHVGEYSLLDDAVKARKEAEKNTGNRHSTRGCF